MAIIDKKDIYSGGDPFEDVKKGIELLLAAEQKLIEQNKELINSYVKIQNTADGEEAKKRTKQTQELADSNEKLTLIQKERIAAQKALEKVEAKLNTLNDENIVLLQKTKKELAEKTRLQKLEAIANDETAGTLERLAAETSILTAKRKKLTDIEGANKQVYDELTAKIKENTQALKGAEAATDNHTRNVGNYKESVKAALSEMGLFSGELNAIGEASGKASGGINLFKTAFGSLRGVLISTGIGALVVAIGSLAAYFTKSSEGSKKLKVALAAIGAVTDKIIEKFAGLGKIIFDAFTNPKKAFDNFINYIKSNVLPVFENLGSLIVGVFTADFVKISLGAAGLKKAFDDIANSAKGFADEIIGAGEAGAEYEKQLQKLAEQERELLILRKETDKQVSERKKNTKDETKTAEENLKLIDEAIQFEKAYGEASLATSKRRLAAMKTYYATKKELTEDEKQELAEAEAAVLESQAETNEKLESLYSERLGFVNEIESERIATLNANTNAEIQSTTELETLKRSESEKTKNEQVKNSKIVKDAVLADNREIKDESQQTADQINNAYVEMFGSIAQASGEFLVTGAKGFKEFSKSVIGTVIDTVTKVVNLYIAQLFAKEIAEKSFAGIATAAILSGLITGTLQAAKSQVQNFAEGGEVKGAGTKTSDSIPARLSNGEFVVKADAYERSKMITNAINRGLINDKTLIAPIQSDQLNNNYLNEIAKNTGAMSFVYEKDGYLHIVSANGNVKKHKI